MPLTLAQLLRHQDLGLSLLTTTTPVDAPILWAHTSELVDPTPWLGGGELIMTLGLGLPEDPAAEDDYVHRLAHRGVVALAVDTGIHLTDVPRGVVEAGERHGLPILRIPPPTPFMAIARAVHSALTADAVEAIKTVAAHQERVAAATLRSGVRGVVESLSGVLHADVAVVDVRGRILEGAGPGLPALHARVLDELSADGRLRRATSMVRVHADAVVTIQSFIGEGQDPQLLVLSSLQAFTAHQRLVVSHAVTLLSLLSRTPQRLASVEGHLRTAVARSLLVEGGTCDPTLANALGFDPAVRVVVAHVVGADVRQAGAAADRIVHQLTGPSLVAALDDGVAIVAAGLTDLTHPLYDRIGTASVGLSEAVPITEVGPGLRRARTAARIARLQGRSVVLYADLAPLDQLLLAQPPTASTALVESVLGPLIAHDRRAGTELVDTLETFLATNGHSERTARILRIHRHTLKQRLERAQSILARDLDSAVVRSDLWLALRARSLLQSAEAPSTVPVTEV